MTALREQTNVLEGHVLKRFGQVKELRQALAGREKEVKRLQRMEGRMKVTEGGREEGREGGREGGRAGEEVERQQPV